VCQLEFHGVDIILNAMATEFSKAKMFNRVFRTCY
jgi:hypothetical protein